jgi:phytoene dehydrogenase-like protein
MSDPTHPSLIVIGGGLSGLSSAIAWALTHDVNREPVLVLEKEPHPGGSVVSYKRKGFRIDTCQMVPDIAAILKYLGVELEWLDLSESFIRLFLVNPADNTTRVTAIPGNPAAFRAMLDKRYPRSAAGVGRFFDYSRRLFQELYDLKVTPGALDIVRMLVKCPLTMANLSANFEKYLARFSIPDQEILEILNIFVSFSGLPANRVHSMVPVSAMNSLLDGVFRPARGFGDLPEKLTQRLKALGGELRTRALVEQILVEKNVVRGVRLTTGEEIRADCVISTIDPKMALQTLLGTEALRAANSAYASKTSRMEMTASTFTVNCCLPDKVDPAAIGLAAGFNVLTTGRAAFARLYAACQSGHDAFSPECFHLGLNYSTLPDGTKPVLTISQMPTPAGHWIHLRESDKKAYTIQKQAMADRFIQIVERYLWPDLRKRIVFTDISSPATYARYSGSPTGSIYDMAATVDNFGASRLKMRTPFRGLYQPKFIHGIFGAVHGGVQAVDMITQGAIMGGRCRMVKGEG